MNTSGRLRQMMFPREFRIPATPWDADAVAQLERVAQLITDQARESAQCRESDSAADRKAFLAEIGTGLWRLRQKMTQPGTNKPLDEMRRAYRHFESVWDTLEKDGIKIYDHTGENFDAGRSIKVLAYQPTPGLRRERVTETIKPTIYAKDDLVQMGEVIVGTPEN
jgi:hypothetical protein